MTKSLSVVAATIALLMAQFTAARAATATGCADAKGADAYPTFCGIPLAPTDVRSAKEFKAAVVDTRQVGRRLVNQSGPATFGLPSNGADAFAQAAKAEIDASAAGVQPVALDTESFAADARRRVIAPPKPHK
jgi:hypothetical protein